MKFRKLLCCAIAVILVLTIMIPTVFAATKCTVTENVLFRQGPGKNYPAYGLLTTGELFYKETSRNLWAYGYPGENTAVYQEFGHLNGYVAETCISW